MHVLTIAASKGGASKTTLAAALAVEAAKTMRVGLVDRDPQQSLARWYELRAAGSKSNLVLCEGRNIGDALAAAQKSKCEFVICDTPPAIMTTIKGAIEAASFVLVACKPSPVDVESIDPVIEMARDAEKPFVFVITIAPTQGGKGLIDGVREYLSDGNTVLKTMMGNRLSYVAAMATGQSGPEIDKTAQTKEEMRDLWVEVSKLMGIRRGRP